MNFVNFFSPLSLLLIVVFISAEPASAQQTNSPESKSAIEVDDNIWRNGIMVSDERYKKNVHTLINVLPRLMEVRGTSFEWNANLLNSQNNEQALQYGVIAQELESVYPELVITEPNGLKTVNYLGLIPILLKAVQEQQVHINEIRGVQLEEEQNMMEIQERLDLQKELNKIHKQNFSHIDNQLQDVRAENKQLKEELWIIKQALGLDLNASVK